MDRRIVRALEKRERRSVQCLQQSITFFGRIILRDPLKLCVLLFSSLFLTMTELCADSVEMAVVDKDNSSSTIVELSPAFLVEPQKPPALVVRRLEDFLLYLYISFRNAFRRLIIFPCAKVDTKQVLKQLAMAEAIVTVFFLILSLFIGTHKTIADKYSPAYFGVFVSVFNIVFTAIFGIVVVGFPCSCLKGHSVTYKIFRKVYMSFLISNVMWSIIQVLLVLIYLPYPITLLIAHFFFMFLAVLNSKWKTCCTHTVPSSNVLESTF